MLLDTTLKLLISLWPLNLLCFFLCCLLLLEWRSPQWDKWGEEFLWCGLMIIKQSLISTLKCLKWDVKTIIVEIPFQPNSIEFDYSTFCRTLKTDRLWISSVIMPWAHSTVVSWLTLALLSLSAGVSVHTDRSPQSTTLVRKVRAFTPAIVHVHKGQSACFHSSYSACTQRSKCVLSLHTR